MTQEGKSAKDRKAWARWLKRYTDALTLHQQGDAVDLEQLAADRVKVMNLANPR